MKRRAIEFIVGLKEDIDNIFSEKHSLPIVKYYSNKFDIPLDISSLYIKQRISRCFYMKSNKFDRKLDNAYIIVSIIKYLLFLIYTLLLSSRRNAIEPNNFELLIEGLQSKSEIDRWVNLEREFNIDNAIFIAKNDIDRVSKHNIFVYKNMRNYERKFLIRLLFKSFFYDIFFLVKNSFNLGVNLIHIHTLYVNDYLYYSNIFKECRAKFMIQDRNLGMTNALKNYLFKKSGGLFSTCTQKNIVQANSNNLFFDTDIFFTLGKKTAEDLFVLGARIDSVIPVGSLNMEGMSDVINQNNNSKEIDILYIGINAVNAKKEDYDGYYDSVRWLANLSIQFPKLEIFIKHHPSCNDDLIEDEITKNTNIKYINKALNSYQLSSQSNLIITYGSTMGYELIGCGLKVLFFDPNKKNPFLISSLSRSKNTIYDYNTAKQTLSNIEEIATIKNKTDYCICNTDVSKSIYQHLTKTRK